MCKLILFFATLSTSIVIGQDYTIIDHLSPQFNPEIFQISEDGVVRTPVCRCSSVEFNVGQRGGFSVMIEHLAGFGNMLLFHLEVPEPIHVHRFQVTSPWSEFENAEDLLLPVKIETQKKFHMRLVGFTSPDFNAGNHFTAQMVISLPSEENLHTIELSGILVGRSGERNYAVVEGPAETRDSGRLTESAGSTSGGPCRAVSIHATARVFDPGTFVVRLDVAPLIELRAFRVLGKKRNPKGFRSVVSVLGPDVALKLPARLEGLVDIYYRLEPGEESGATIRDGEEIGFELVIGGCPSGEGTPSEEVETLTYRARPMY